MITLSNVSKKFGNQEVLKKINLSLPRTGLIIIKGPSGCGKTTLLNLLSGLLSFEGDIIIDGHQIKLMNGKQMDDYRLKNYGFIFQDFKLFENESVINNIMFPLQSVSNASLETRNRKCRDLVNMVGLKQNIKQNVNKLSGGEKQRVAIARALVNNPKIVLADEPTGSLDNKNVEEIMKILEKVSAKSLVVMVSHDDDLSKRYGDQIIEMSDGEIKRIIKQDKHKETKYIPVAKMFYSEKKTSIPSSFLIRHTINSIKQKKWRTMICNGITSLGLIGVGLATTLSSAISTNIKKSYSQIIDDSKITISKKNDDKSIYGRYAASYYEVSELAEKHKEQIYDVGITYDNDFESFFPQTNCICLADTTYRRPIEGISARHINEFRWLDVEKPNTIYPESIDYLKNDEVVLSLTIDMIREICFKLQIERTVTSLSRYLQTNTLKIYFDLKNEHWEYWDQQILTVVGFTLETKPGIYHYNHMWNEHMYEERMRFPSTDNFEKPTQYPWTLKKIYYVYVRDNVDSFLSLARQEKQNDSFIFEIANSQYYPWYLKEIPAKSVQRVLIFANTLYNIPLSDFDLFKEVSSDITSPIYGNSTGYAIYPSSMLYGFANMMYFSNSEDSLFDAIDISSSVATSGNETYKLPDGVLSGHFSQSLTGGVSFSNVDGKEVKGKSPTDIYEIVISSKMNRDLFNGQGIGQTLYVSYQSNQTTNSSGQVFKQFKTTELNVVGIVDMDKNVIFHKSDWTINFFQIMFDVSAFSLGVNAMMVDVKDTKNIDKIVSKLKRAFPEYDILEPMKDVNESVNQVCTYVEIALMCFSIIAVIISTLLLSISNYLFVLENRKEIGLARCIGINKKESKKFVITHSVVMCLSSFLVASVELFISSFIINSELAKAMSNSFIFSFNPLSLVYMFALAFSISILSSLLISKKINKLDPLAAIKA